MEFDCLYFLNFFIKVLIIRRVAFVRWIFFFNNKNITKEKSVRVSDPASLLFLDQFSNSEKQTCCEWWNWRNAYAKFWCFHVTSATLFFSIFSNFLKIQALFHCVHLTFFLQNYKLNFYWCSSTILIYFIFLLNFILLFANVF